MKNVQLVCITIEKTGGQDNLQGTVPRCSGNAGSRYEEPEVVLPDRFRILPLPFWIQA